MAPQDCFAEDLVATAKAALWAPAAALPSICTVIAVTLEISTSNYVQWCGMFSDAVKKYALEAHILENNCPANPTPQWVWKKDHLIMA
jgi:hypothetical protein